MIEPASSPPATLYSAVLPGVMFDYSRAQHPTLVSGWSGTEQRFEAVGTHFGYVHSGEVELSASSGEFRLRSGMYFAVPGQATIRGSGEGFVASRIGYTGFFQVGGPIEETGRLRYIDGCTDSLLCPPVTSGDPCLNLLSIPRGTNQTTHTHPSLRVGIIVAGEGICRTPNSEQVLKPGLVFVIHAGGKHSFHTRDKSLLIVAWHPDSDFGPTHEEHPMLNRTLVDGRPIRTGELA